MFLGIAISPFFIYILIIMFVALILLLVLVLLACANHAIKERRIEHEKAVPHGPPFEGVRIENLTNGITLTKPPA